MKTFIKAFYFPLLFLLSTFASADGLTGVYYDNNSFTAPSTLTRVDSTINFEWGSGSPDGSISNDNYSIEWSGYIYIPEDANYIFSLAHDDVIVLNINGVELYNNSTWTGGANNYNDTATRYYTTGYYPITIKFEEWSGGAYARFAWGNDVSIGAGIIVPTTNLFTSIGGTIESEYRFDDCAGSFVEDSVGTTGAQAHNGVVLDVNDSIVCSSAYFDGVNDYVSMGDSFNNIFGSTNDKFTITGWIKPTGFNPATSNHGTANTIFAKASDGSNDNLEIGVNSTGSLHVYIDASTDVATNIGSGVTLNNWHFIAISYDGSTLSATIDGTSYTSSTHPSGNFANATGSPFTVGTTLHSDTSFNGLIDEVKIFNYALSAAEISTIYTNENAGNDYLGATRTCPSCARYCSTNSLAEGFHIIDPDGGDDSNSYEIYCDMTSAKAPRELIALPLKNDYNNFVFRNDSPSSNYYAEADSARTTEAANSFNFLEIKIDETTNEIEVVPSSVAEGSSNQGYFSNINLIGTPFAIDWTNTTLSNCDTGKLRIGAWDQAVKINTLDHTNGRCRVDNMRLELLSEYTYLTYSDIRGESADTETGFDEEILMETCRQIFEKVPNDSSHLLTVGGQSNGYFWVDPDLDGRVVGDTVTTKFRPFVGYCKYQEDINQAWTFVMALDAKVTNSKNDIKTMAEVRANPSIYHDTCSQLGLLFYVPNTKDNFERTQEYLFDNKTEWINYTGTIREKYKMYTNTPSKEYYKAGEGYNEIWPYGPFGVYYPSNGSSSIWSEGASSAIGNMAGRCMNSGTASGAEACTDWVHSNVVANDDGTMGIRGWRTTLMDQVDAGLSGITDGDKWWIADVGAGNYIHNSSLNSGTPECSISSPGSNRATSGACDEQYYEPDGNYYKDAWLNFISDSNGNVYHLDDYNAFYSYYDYMCMSWDNYYVFSRVGLTQGPFEVIEHGFPVIDTSGGYPVTAPTDFNITTKIVNKSMNFDVLLLSNDRGNIVDDQNISAGIFLIDADGAEAVDLVYYGDIGSGGTLGQYGPPPKGVLTLPATTVAQAYKRVAFEFKYCAYQGDWEDCWNTSGSGANIKADCNTSCEANSAGCPCKVANSDDFALRPFRFAIASLDGTFDATLSTLVVRAEDVNMSYRADDFSGVPTDEYNASFNDLDFNISIENLGLPCTTTELSNVNQTDQAFEDGIDINTTTLSDIGIYTFKIKEIETKEFAIVDANDTAWEDRQIMENNISLTIKPHHFIISEIPNPNHNKDGNFTYLAKHSSLNIMAGRLDFNVTARNEKNVTTPNYTDACYASNINLDINFSVPIGVVNDTIFYTIKDVTLDNNTTTDGNDSTFIKAGDTVSKSLFTNDVNGTANIALRFNFGRDNNATVNPFIINFNNVNVSDQNTSVTINTIDSNQTQDINATFVYGRVSGPKRAPTRNCIDDPAPNPPCNSADDSARIIFQIYRDTSGSIVPALNGATRDGTQDSRWWTSPFHTAATDGNFSIVVGGIQISEVNGDTKVTHNKTDSTYEGNFKYKAVLEYDESDGYIKRAFMRHTPSPWLIYDEDNIDATFNTFKFNFIKEGWSGIHESSTTTTTKSSNKTNRRIMW